MEDNLLVWFCINDFTNPYNNIKKYRSWDSTYVTTDAFVRFALYRIRGGVFSDIAFRNYYHKVGSCVSRFNSTSCSELKIINNFKLTVDGSSRGVSISACLKKTLPRHARQSILSNGGILSRKMTPATNLTSVTINLRINYLFKQLYYQCIQNNVSRDLLRDVCMRYLRDIL